MEQQTNITQTIMETINTIFDNLFSSINDSLYDVLDKLVFINSNILQDSNFKNIFGSSSSNGILLIANSLLLGFILYFAIKHLFAYLTLTNVDKPISFIFKLIIFGILMNFSYFFLEIFIDLISNISMAITELGKNLFHQKICFSSLIDEINSNISITEISSLDIFSLDGLIKGSLTLSMLNLIFTYSLRYVLVKVFILLAPFAFLSLCTNSSAWFFKAWFKNLFSLLFIQIIVSVVLVLLFSSDYSDSNLFVKFIYIGGLYALIKANSTVREFLGGLSTNVAQSVNNFSKSHI